MMKYGKSHLVASVNFVYQLNVDRMELVNGPVIPAPYICDISKEHDSRHFYLTLSVATGGVTKTPREILGESPTLLIPIVSGAINSYSYRFANWQSSTKMMVYVQAYSALDGQSAEFQLQGVNDSDHRARWKNPAVGN